MTKEELLKQYPSILKCSLDIGEGWTVLVENLCILIENHSHFQRPEIHEVVARQIKEKFGGLRFYYDGGDAFIRGAVTFAEQLSYHICEMCGAPGKLRHKSWLQTLCNEHNQEPTPGE